MPFVHDLSCGAGVLAVVVAGFDSELLLQPVEMNAAKATIQAQWKTEYGKWNKSDFNRMRWIL
jgi:diaminopimelate epimerase